jgi:hypothetical protein
VTPAAFRKMALALDGAEERVHMGHPDFRVRGRIFATLGYPDGGHGMVTLTPDQQADVMETDRAGAFAPAAGAWGRKGATTVDLGAADRELVRIALEAAWKNRSTPAKRSPGGK